MSTNGTWVNGERIDGKKALHVNDEIRVGDTVLMFCGVVSSEPYDTTAPAREEARSHPQADRGAPAPVPSAGEGHSGRRARTTKEMAAQMYVGEAAVKAHLATLYEKFEIPEAGQQRRALLAEACVGDRRGAQGRLRRRSRLRHLARTTGST